MYPSICVWSQISNSWGKQSRPNSATLSRMRASQYSRSFSVWAATLRALLAAPVLGEEGLERGPDVLLAFDEDGLEVVRVEAAEDVEHRALVVARAERLDLAVAEEVADLGQLLGGPQCSRIVGVEVVAVRAVEGVDVPQGRVVARLDDLERLHVARRDERPARLALVEELLLGDLVRLGVVRDEDDLDVAVLGADELVEQEEETARQVLLHGVHGPGGVHDAHHDGVRLPLHVGHHAAVDQVVVVEGEALAGGCEPRDGRGLDGGVGVGPAARELALHPRADGADGDLDDLLAVLPDDRLLGDDVRDVLADRLADLQTVASAIPRRAVAALGAGAFEGPEDGLEGAVHERREGPTGVAGQSFPRLLAAYLSTTSTQLSQ